MHSNAKYGDFSKPYTQHDALVAELAQHLINRIELGRDLFQAALDARDWKFFVDYELNYNTGTSVSEVIATRQLLALFSKNEDLDIGVDKKAIAVAKFMQAEQACVETNRIFTLASRGAFFFIPRVCSQLWDAKRKIAKMLGRVPHFRDMSLRFGPGSTTGTTKANASISAKFAEGIVCSERLYRSGLLSSALREVPHWSKAFSDDGVCTTSEGSFDYDVERVTCTISPGYIQFVPKNASSYRSIGVEPNLNMMLQLGIGDYITKRLKRYGIDIRDQVANQELARVGSLTGEYATLDLSSASDTISREFVRFMLPEEWFYLLDSTRCDTYIVDDTVLHLEKFCSMGNGFTFPLETLLFWALTRAVVKQGEILTYGDDIICPTGYAGEVMNLLTSCGFTINKSKSFTYGPFRESCGADYYFGIDVRPTYIRHKVSVQSLFVLHNFLVRHYEEELAKIVLEHIPDGFRLYGPDGYGDGHLLGDFTKHRSRKVLAKQYGGYSFDTLVFEKCGRKSIYPGDWVSPLYHVYMRQDPANVITCLAGLDPLSKTDGRSGDLIQLVSPTSLGFTKWGVPLWPTPGKGRVKRISIYTF